MLSVSLLGDLCIRHNGAPVTDVDTPRLQSLLAYLLLHSDAPQPRAHLAFLFWPDTNEAQARTNLRNLLHHLRRALPDADSYLEATVHALQWRSGPPFTLDVADFNAALARARESSQAGDFPALRQALEQVVDLYRGDLLPSCYDDWIIPEREELCQAYLAALERLARLLEDQRDYPAAIGSAQRLLRHDPLHEAAYRRLMRLHALNGDRAGALQVYHTCATVLRRELDVEPSAATHQTYERLLGAESQPSPPQPVTTAFSPTVGRDSEWAQMVRAWRAVAAGGEPHVVMLRGEAGIGKTRLAEDLLQWAARQGIAAAYARCYAAEGQLAYAPIIAWLRARPLPPLEDVWLAEVARLLPELLASRPDLPRPVALTEAWQRQRLFEALARAALGAGRPRLLALDDLQWCDRDTLEWLHFLLRFDPKARLLLVGAYRPEEVGDGHSLLSSLQALRLEGRLTEIDLGPLDEAATQTLAAHIAGVEISPAAARLLYRETEGNPLFVVETVRAGLPLQEPDDAALEFSHQLLPGSTCLPPKVRSVLEARLAQLSPTARALAEQAAAIGREFSFRLLASAGGSDEDTLVRQLDELWQRRIVREHGVDAYDFCHDKLREVAYDGMSAARRRLLHRHAAKALELLHAADLDPVSPQLAAHCERAGLPEQAAPYYLRAAQVARRVYANEEAIALLRRGLALAEVDDPLAARGLSGHEVAAGLYEEFGDLLGLRAEHAPALQAYHHALAWRSPADRIGQARVHRKVGGVRREQRLYAEALDACRRAETVLGSLPGDDAAEWQAEWLEVQVDRVWAHYWLAQWPEMQELVNKVRPLVQQGGSAASRARFLTASISMRLRRDRYAVSDEMLADQYEALAAGRECGDPKIITDCRFGTAFLHLWRRELNAAEENLRAALVLAETCGDAWVRALSLTYLTILCRFRGHLEGVADCALRAEEAAIAAHMPDYVAAAKGNQAWLAWRRQDLPSAEQSGHKALALWRQSPLVYPFQWQALWPLIAVALAQGCEDDACAYAQTLLDPAQQRLPDDLTAALQAALQAKTAGQVGAARPHLDRALDLAHDMGYL